MHRAALHGNNNLALMPFPRDCALAASLTSLELSACSMFSLPAQVQPPQHEPDGPGRTSYCDFDALACMCTALCCACAGSAPCHSVTARTS